MFCPTISFMLVYRVPIFAQNPFVQSYAANSDYLDDLNAIYFSVNGPEYLIWHANRNGVFESIDGRSSFSDAPHSTQAIFFKL